MVFDAYDQCQQKTLEYTWMPTVGTSNQLMLKHSRYQNVDTRYQERLPENKAVFQRTDDECLIWMFFCSLSRGVYVFKVSIFNLQYTSVYDFLVFEPISSSRLCVIPVGYFFADIWLDIPSVRENSATALGKIMEAYPDEALPKVLCPLFL